MAVTNVCQGCLSADRKLILIEEHTKLYQQLLLKKVKNKIKKLFLCWECHRMLNNIHTFRIKITHAQKLLNYKSLPQCTSLSNLTILKKTDDYHMIIYEDEKANNQIEVEVEKIKNEKPDYCEDDKLELLDVKELDTDLIVNKLKIEPKNEDDGSVYSDDRDEIKGPDELLVPIELLEKKTEIKVQQGRKKRGVLKKKYRTIIMDDIADKRSFYDIVNIDREGAEKWIAKQKKRTSAKKYQCPRCYCGFAQERFYQHHLAVRHAQKHKYECDLCGFRFPELRRLRRHVRAHFVQFACRLCAAHFRARNHLYTHLAHGPHARQMECLKCGARFDCNKPREFFDHYHAMHGLNVCDYCGLRCTRKSRLIHHIRIRHTPIVCKLCDLKLSSLGTLKVHELRKHVSDPSERNYCVECDAQFANSALYDEHVRRSVKHCVRPRVQCPECEKTYSKRSYMKNHYDIVHKKEGKNVCPLCFKSFLTGHRLRSHVKYIHEKVPKPRNHMCNYCGRGFNTKRILANHIRTHTGERPFACARCPAAFAQVTALKTHEKSAHK